MSTGFNYRPWIVVAILIGAWQWALGDHAVVSDTLVAPGPVLHATIPMLIDGSALKAGGQTLLTTLVGLALGGGTAVSSERLGDEDGWNNEQHTERAQRTKH